jgi:hypothetical protein
VKVIGRRLDGRPRLAEIERFGGSDSLLLSSGIPPASRIIGEIGFRWNLFFMANLRDRGSDLLVRRIALLCNAVRRVRACAPFRIDDWVVLAGIFNNYYL